MYAGRVACCLQVSQALLMLQKPGQTDGRQTVGLTLRGRCNNSDKFE